jgi:hypothetical protein
MLHPLGLLIFVLYSSPLPLFDLSHCMTSFRQDGCYTLTCWQCAYILCLLPFLPCAFFNIFLMNFIFGSSVNLFQRCILSSHNSMHASSSLLMLTNEVRVIIFLCSFSSCGVTGVVHTSNSSICCGILE